jgi:hypothetical protein
MYKKRRNFWRIFFLTRDISQRPFSTFFSFFLRGSVVPFPAGFCYRQLAMLLRLLGTTIITIPTLSLEHLHRSLPAYLVLHSLFTEVYLYVPFSELQNFPHFSSFRVQAPSPTGSTGSGRSRPSRCRTIPTAGRA